jgi:hypothetical protein
MSLPWITESQLADAAHYGHVFAIGQFKHDPQRKRTLEQQCRRGAVVKVRAMWPWLTLGTCTKTCYVYTSLAPCTGAEPPKEDERSCQA